MAKGKGKIKYSVRLTFITIFFLFIVLAIGMLNIYPTISSRDIVISSKQTEMMSQASVMSSSLSALESLSADGVDQVMQLINVNEFDRVVVTGPEGATLYDTAERSELSETGQLSSALGGMAVFDCRYDGDAFTSHAAAPVLSLGRVIGAVCISDVDTEQALLISGIQSKLRNISMIAGLLALLAVYAFTDALTRRIRELNKAMRIVREGNYDYRITPGGADEVTELAEEFNDMTRRIQNNEELRRRFVSDASHELRTPLASIRLLSDSVVQNENMDVATMREFVTDIGSEAERLQRLTEKLMKLTRMDSGVERSAETLDIRRSVERAAHLLEPLAKKKDVTIYCEMEEGVFIRGVEDEIYQIVFNLAENAIKYNSFGGNVFIRLGREDGQARLCVEDTGIGIPEEDLPHVFSRFYRVDKARSREAGGSGLGLSIVHDAVIANGGSIVIEPRETVGTRVTVTFPIDEGVAEKTEGVDK